MSKPNILNTMELCRLLLQDPDRKSLFRIVTELTLLFIRYRELPLFYFSRYLFKKQKTNIQDYLPTKFLYKIKARFNEENVREVLENKLFFDYYFRQLEIQLPQIWMFNHRNIFVINTKKFSINNGGEFKEVLKNLFVEKSANAIIIKKTYWSYEGEHVYKLTISDLQDDKKLKELYRTVVETGFLFQEVVCQHSELDRLNSSCLNTIRFDTFIDQSGNIEIMSAYLRTNIKGHHVDNESSGGCEIPIDFESGRLKKYGHLMLKYNGLKLLTEHPVTKVGFENFKIPFFTEAKELAIAAASYIPGLRLVGWDIAIGESGPILIEGNSDYDISASDLAYGGYRKNPVFQKVLKEIGYL
jgi:hypothetical protein